MKNVLLIALMVLLEINPPQAKGDFVVTIGSTPQATTEDQLKFAAGVDVVLGLYIHSTTNLSAQEFTLAFDISEDSPNGYDGYSAYQQSFFDFEISLLDTFVNLANPSTIDWEESLVGSSISAPAGFDVLADIKLREFVNFTATSLQTNAKHIGNIRFKTSSLATPGEYGFKFNPNALFDENDPFSLVSNTPNADLDAGANGQFYNRFIITAVPEPSSMALVGLVSVGMCLARRRRASV